MQFTYPATKDNVEGQLDSNISASALTITVKAGEGAKYPATPRGNATSGGDNRTLNSTGIGATGIQVGSFIRNVTDGSHCFVRSVTTNSITTTSLLGGTDNTWQNADEYVVNSFVITLNRRDADGNITDVEKVAIKYRSGDTLHAETDGRGYDGTTQQEWETDEYVNIFVESSLPHIAIQKALTEIHEELDKKASIVYVDSSLDQRNWKDPVKVATTVAGTLATSFEAGDVVDSYVLVAGDRILIKDQAAASENGIYVVNASGAPTRATDFDAPAEVTAAAVPVEQGSANADTIWLCTSDNPVIDTNNILFQQLGGSSIWNPGDVKESFRTNPDPGWLLLDNSEKNMTTYEQLVKAIGFAGGVGSNVATFTVTAATDKINKASHGLAAGTLISFTNSGGALPAGLTANTIYYVKNPGLNDFEVSLSNGGLTVDITGAGTGTHSYQTTFKLPQHQGRMPVGKDSGTFNALGKLTGNETKNFTHLHNLSANGRALIGQGTAYGDAIVGWKSNGGAFTGNWHGRGTGGYNTGASGNVSNGTELGGTTDNDTVLSAADVRNPSVTVNFFIKY